MQMNRLLLAASLVFLSGFSEAHPLQGTSPLQGPSQLQGTSLRNFKNATVLCFEDAVVAQARLAFRTKSGVIEKFVLTQAEIDTVFLNDSEDEISIVGEGSGLGGTRALKFQIYLEQPSRIYSNQVVPKAFKGALKFSRAPSKWTHLMWGDRDSQSLYCNVYPLDQKLILEFDDGSENRAVRF
jgi:hypothetical protein